MKVYLSCLILIALIPACVTTRSQMAEPEAPAPVVTSTQMERSPQRSSSYGLEEIKSNLAQLTGRLEELEMRFNKSLEKTFEKSENYQSILSRLEVIEKKLAEPPPPPPAPPAPEPKDLLKNAKHSFEEGNFENALESLNEYLKASKPAALEEATFLRGETYFKLKKFKKAIVDYSRFPEKFPKSTYHPKALLKIGESFEELGLKDEAKAFFSDLVEKFPKSSEAKAAKKKITKKK